MHQKIGLVLDMRPRLDIIHTMEPLLPEHKQRPHLEQWQRVGRWYKKIMQVKHGLLKKYTHEELLDVVYAYFLNVQHLADWVRNSNPLWKDDVRVLTKKPCFVVCGDFINNHKHFERSASANAQDREAAIRHQSVKVTCGTFALTRTNAERIEQEAKEEVRRKFSRGAEYTWQIDHAGNQYDVYKLAADCYTEWDNFFREQEPKMTAMSVLEQTEQAAEGGGPSA